MLTTAAVALSALLAAPAIAVDSAPRVKPRKGLRKHVDKRKRGGGTKGKKTIGAIGITSKFQKDTPLWVVRQIFHCALDYDEGTGFDCYVKHNSEINKGTSRALKHLRRYQWRHFRKWAATYVLKAKQFSVFVTRWNPKGWDGSTRDIRIYLRSRQRDNPAPVMLRREGGLWKVYANSL